MDGSQDTPHKAQTSAPIEREQEGPPRTPEQDPGRAWGWGGEGRSAHATPLLLSTHRGPGHTPGAHLAAQAQSRPGAAWLHPHRTGGGLKSQGLFKGPERKFTPDRPHSEAPGGDSTTLHLVHEQSKHQGEREGGTRRQRERQRVWAGLGRGPSSCSPREPQRSLSQPPRSPAEAQPWMLAFSLSTPRKEAAVMFTAVFSAASKNCRWLRQKANLPSLPLMMGP